MPPGYPKARILIQVIHEETSDLLTLDTVYTSPYLPADPATLQDLQDEIDEYLAETILAPDASKPNEESVGAPQ